MKYTVTLCLLLTFLCFTPASGQWTPTVGPFGSTHVATLLAKDSKLVASTTCGTFIKDAASESWVRYPANRFISYTVKDGDIYACSYFDPHGIWILDPNHVDEIPQSIFPGSTLLIASSDDFLFKYADYSGVSRSADGINWTDYNDGLPQENSGGFAEYDISAMTVARPFIYCSTDKGIYRNDINPTTWTLANNGLPEEKATFINQFDNTLYTAIGKTLYKSSDQGANWSEFYTAAGQVTAMLKSGGDIYLGTENGVLMSTDGGSQWQSLSDGLKDNHITCLTMYQSEVVCGTDLDGIYILKGSEWQRYGIGLNCEPAFTLTGNADGQSLITASYGRMFSYDNQANTWTALKVPYEDDQTITLTKLGLPVMDQDTIFAFAELLANNSGPKFSLIYSTDNGNTWQGDNNAQPFGYTIPEILKINNRIFGSSGDVFATTNNGGITWKNITPEDPLSLDAHNWNGYNGYIYGITGANRIIRFDNNYKYPKWKEADTGIPADKKILAVINTDEALFAMAPGEMYVSTDDAASWSRVDVALPFERIRNWTYYKNILFVTCDQGIFYTKDRGNTWTSLNDGLESPDLTVAKIAFGHIFVVNNAVTVLKRSISELLSTSDNVAENQMMLYPNPADQYFTITSIPEESNLQYRISDMKGAVVRSGKIADGGQVNVNTLTAGMYIVTVMSDKGNLTGKLIIQR